MKGTYTMRHTVSCLVGINTSFNLSAHGLSAPLQVIGDLGASYPVDDRVQCPMGVLRIGQRTSRYRLANKPCAHE